MNPIKSVHVVIEGRVQGVWFRGWTVQQASARGLSGWVRNLADGRVEALFHGPAPMVEEMVEACRHGPSAAAVTGLTATPSSEPAGHGFHQRPTA